MPDAARLAGTITGDAGATWTNNTDKVMWQLQVSFQNSCAVCIQNAGSIARWWPIPFHHGCNCRQTPIAPGARSDPFVDFQREVEQLEPAQQSRVMGAGNYRLVKEGKVQWTDVVTKTRIRPLHEVVQRAKLTEKELIKAGLSPRVARDALAKVQAPQQQAARSAAAAAVDRLKQLGLTDQQIRDAVKAKLAARAGVVGKPSGPSGPGRGPVAPPPAPPRGGGPTGGFTSPVKPRTPAPAAPRRIAARPATQPRAPAATKDAAREIAAQIIATPPAQRSVSERIEPDSRVFLWIASFLRLKGRRRR